MKEKSSNTPDEKRPNVLSGILKRVGAVAALMLMLRTSFEDKMLQAELHGYQDYVQIVVYRLVPGIW